MEHRKLGASGIEVPVVFFGAWAIGGWFWGGTDDRKAEEAIRAAVDEGITAIDTAPMYGFGHSETVVGRAIRGIRDRVLVATKCGLRWDRADGEFFFETVDAAGCSAKVFRVLKKSSILEECDRSLMRLGVDVIDLYQCHWPDATTPLEETMDAMAALLERGKIRAIGVSNFTHGMMERCLACAPVASAQEKYNLLARDVEEGVLPLCRERNVALLAYSPLQQGLLTGKVSMEREFPTGDFRAEGPWFQEGARRRVLAALEKIRPIAQDHGATLGQVAIAWLLGRPGVTAAIVGVRSPEQARENAGAAGLSLTREETERIEAAFAGVGGVR